MKVAQVVHPDFTTLDLIGSYRIISRWSVADTRPRRRRARREDLMRRPAAESPHPR